MTQHIPIEMRDDPGYVYPLSYKSQNANKELNRLLANDKTWWLDIRFDPERGPTKYQGHLLQSTEKQYRHAKGLGLINGKLARPDAAIKKVLEMVANGNSFVLFSDSMEHAVMVGKLIRETAEQQGMFMIDPYWFNPGDLCSWHDETNKYANIILERRCENEYEFTATKHTSQSGQDKHEVTIDDLGGLIISAYDISSVVEPGAYLCAHCGKGDQSVHDRGQADGKLCQRCFEKSPAGREKTINNFIAHLEKGETMGTMGHSMQHYSISPIFEDGKLVRAYWSTYYGEGEWAEPKECTIDELRSIALEEPSNSLIDLGWYVE